jgi:general secretion pathway protein H
MRRESGFTLLELLVVIAIMATLSVAFPLALNRFVPARRADAAARELVADIRYAQTRSVAARRALALEPTRHGYRIVAATEPNGQVVAVREWRASTELALESLAGAAAERMRVFGDGSTTGGRFTIRDGGRERIITVSELTGRIKLGT